MVSLGGSDQPIAVPYSFFYDQVEAGNVSEVLFQDNQVQGTFKASVTYPPSGSPELAQGVTQQRSTSFTTTLLTDSVPDPQLVQSLRDHNVTIIAQTVETSPILLFLFNFGPIILLLGFFLWSARRQQGQMGNVFGFGKTQAREYTVERPNVTFADVAGQDAPKAELVEIVDFLKEPDKYIALGARIPAGCCSLARLEPVKHFWRGPWLARPSRLFQFRCL